MRFQKEGLEDSKIKLVIVERLFCIICTANEWSGIFPLDTLSESKVQVGEMRSRDYKSNT